MNGRFKYHPSKLMKYLVISLIYIQFLYVSDCYAQVNRKALQASLDYDNQEVNLSITNNGDDTIFLFSSYFNIDRSKLRYLYRINNECNTVKISFLPILPYLRCSPISFGDRIILENPEVQKETLDLKALYRFIAIPPKHTENIVIHIQDIFNKTSYIRESEFNPKQMLTILPVALPQPIEVEPDKQRTYVFEFALYSNIKDITLDNYLYDAYKFVQAAKNYCILKIFL